MAAGGLTPPLIISSAHLASSRSYRAPATCLHLTKVSYHPAAPCRSAPLTAGVAAQTELLTFVLFWTLSNNFLYLF